VERAMKNRVITVKGADVTITTRNEQDFISLTDMLRHFGDESILYNRLRYRNTIQFLDIRGCTTSRFRPKNGLMPPGPSAFMPRREEAVAHTLTEILPSGLDRG
jgi:hypothetical protein